MIWHVVSEVVFHPPPDTLFSPRTPEKRAGHWSLSPLLLFTSYLSADGLYIHFICICKACLSQGALMNPWLSGNILGRGKFVIRSNDSAKPIVLFLWYQLLLHWKHLLIWCSNAGPWDTDLLQLIQRNCIKGQQGWWMKCLYSNEKSHADGK